MKPFILVKQVDIAHVIPLNDILYCRAERSYSKLYLLGREPIKYSRPLSMLCEQLNDYFMKVSKSFVICKHHIRQINKKEKTIIMINGDVVLYSIKTTDLLRSLEYDLEVDKNKS